MKDEDKNLAAIRAWAFDSCLSMYKDKDGMLHSPDQFDEILEKSKKLAAWYENKPPVSVVSHLSSMKSKP